MSPAAELRSSALWRNAYIALGVSLALLVVIYRTTATSTVALWSNDPLAHGYLVIPVVLYLVWERRLDLESSTPQPAIVALLLLAVLAFLWLLANLAGTDVIQQICLIAMVAGFAWAVLGTRAARILLFPLAFLLFALPLGDRLIPVLQDLAARFAVKMLDATGIPVLLQGNVISIPGSTWQVAEACSGINYLMSSLAIGYVYAGTTYRYWNHRLGFFLAAALLPLIANGIRVYTTILIASLGETRIIAGTQHYLWGWLVFTIIIGLLFLTCAGWREERPASGESQEAKDSDRRAVKYRSPVVVAALALLVVGMAPLSARLYGLPVERSVRQPLAVVSQPWRVADRDPHSWSPRFGTPSSEFLQAYEVGDRIVTLYVAYYAATQPGVKLASASNVLFDDPRWAARTGRNTVTHDRQTFDVRETVLEGKFPSLMVWNWYWVDGTFTSNDYAAKLLLAKARLFRSQHGSAAIAVATEHNPGRDPAAVLEDFLSHLLLTESPSP